MRLQRPCGSFDTRYEHDMRILRTKTQWGLLGALLVFVFILPLFGSSYVLSMMNGVGITLIAVMGLQLLTGYSGQFSLGQSAFVGVGAYSSAILSRSFGFPFWAALPCAALCAGIAGLVFGIPAFRLKGFYLALSTIAAQFVFVFVVMHLPVSLAGGVWGLHVEAPRLGGFVFKTDGSMYYIIMVLVVLTTIAAKNLVRTKVGRAFVAIRDNDLAAQTMGVNLLRYKLLAFFLCSLYAGIAGSLFAHYYTYVSVEGFTLWFSIWYVGMLIVGGLGSISGAIFGVGLLKGLEAIVIEVGPALGGGGGLVYPILNILFALVIMVFLIFEPRGLAHRWETLKASYRLWPFSY
ncbi:branched-chain amino acid ABC transporter permease [Chloroflexota bacterium]